MTEATTPATTETRPTKVALLKLALTNIHELAGNPPIDGGRIKAIVEETFEQLAKCGDQ